MKIEKKHKNLVTFILLHAVFFLYSLGGICSKYAGQSEFLSLRFFVFYGLVILDLAIYAIAWQQVLKRIPLVTAYANKAVTVIWGLLWGILLFGESISVQKVLGIVIIIIGIVLVVRADEK